MYPLNTAVGVQVLQGEHNPYDELEIDCLVLYCLKRGNFETKGPMQGG